MKATSMENLKDKRLDGLLKVINFVGDDIKIILNVAFSR